MKTIINTFKNFGFVTLCFTMLSGAVNAATFTAIASGDFNAGTTWAGGVAPGAMVSSDVVIIPSGFTVTLTSDENFSSTSSLTVGGTLTSASYASALIMSGSSTLAGAGVITVDSVALGLISGVTFAGTLTAQRASSMGVSLTAASTVTVVETLHLMSGILSVGAGTLIMSPGSTIEVTAGTITVGGTGMIDLHYAHDVSYISSSVTSGIELTGTGLNNLTINVPGAVTMSSDVTVNGMVTLTSGNLALNSSKLIFGATGDFSASGMGAISGTSASGIVINATNNITGALRFASTGNVLGTLDVNFGNNASYANLGSSIIVTGTLTLSSGRIVLGANNLSVAAGGTVSGGSANSFVVTDGAGKLSMNLVAGGSAKFNVGTSLTNYTPMIITANTGSASGDVSINALGNVYTNGVSGTSLSATQPVVNATWYVSSTATAPINYDMQAMWNTSMEVNGFDRNQAFISHNMSGTWDVTTASAATMTGGMYSMTRAGITSLSPFTVADVNTFTTNTPVVLANNNTSIKIYPNPVTNTLYFDGNANADKVYIMSMDGRVVRSIDGYNNSVSVEDLQAGNYSIYFVGKDYKEGQTFVKQ